MRFFYLIIYSLLIQYSKAQNTIQGKIYDGNSHTSLEGVAVYISNTSLYTTSNKDGSFELQNVPSGNMQLIFSMVGYEKLVLTTAKLKSNDQYNLTPKKNELDAVVIQTYDKDGWAKYGKFFLEQFIGTLSFSDECILENYRDLKFKYYKKSNELSVTCDVPLIIKNYYLGYNIRYDLIEFRYSYSSKFLFFGGYPSFQNMDVKDSKYKRYLKRRLDIYTGSQMHFFRSLYNHTAIQEGFQMHHIWEEPNYEKVRVQKIMDSIQDFQYVKNSILIKYRLDSIYTKDSLHYYNNVMRQPDFLTLMKKNPLSINQVIQDYDSISKVLEYKDELLVLFRKKKEDYKYAYYNTGMKTDSCITSILNDLPDANTQIHKDGSFYPFTNIIQQKYWAWSEKISSLLPFDYEPIKITQ